MAIDISYNDIFAIIYVLKTMFIIINSRFKKIKVSIFIY